MIKNKKIVSLIILSFIGFLSFYAEVLIHGWAGLKWISNFYFSLLFLPIIFVLWIKLFLRKDLTVKNISKFLFSYFTIFILIFLFLHFIYNFKLTMLLLYFPIFDFLDPILFEILIAGFVFGNFILIFVVLYFENMYLAKLFDFKLEKKEKVIIFFQPIYIFIFAELLLIIFFYLKLFPNMNRFELDNSIFVFKTGTIVFSSVLAEGIFLIKKIDISK